VAELHIFDFDGTLFRSPGPPPEWDGDFWYEDETSLDAPYVPPKPGPEFWNAPVVASARKSIGDPDTLAVVVTGRSAHKVFKYRVPELLRGAGLRFDDVYLNPGMDTASFKKRVLYMLLQRHPSIDVVHIWEDDLDRIREYVQFLRHLGKQVFPHPFRTTEKPAVAKYAGLFEPPPAMKADIFSWMRSIYAGHVLAQVRDTLNKSVGSRRVLIEKKNKNWNISAHSSRPCSIG